MPTIDTTAGPATRHSVAEHIRDNRPIPDAPKGTPRITTRPKPAEEPKAAEPKPVEEPKAEKPKAAARPVVRPIVVKGGPVATATPWKLLILAEMVGLLGAAFVVNRDPSQPWVHQLVTAAGLKRLIAVIVLLVLLTLGADLGLGGPAAVFGGIVVLSYLTGHAVAGERILAFERSALK